MPESSYPDPRLAADLDAVDAALDGRRVEADRQSLAELAVLLRDERPAVDAETARRLDERFAAARRQSPPAAGRRRRLWAAVTRGGRTWWPAATAVACVLLAAVVVFDQLRGAAPLGEERMPEAGATAARPGEERSAPDVRRAERAAGEDMAGSGAAAPMPPAVPGGTVSDPTDASRRRLVERSAFLTLTTGPGDLTDVASRIVRATDDAGGYVASSTVGEAAGRTGGASFELRVPARELPKTLAALSRLADVTERSETTRDITADAGRTSRRIEELRAERRGLLRALERAAGPGEAARIRARLRVVARRTAAERSAGRRLRSRAAFATVSVHLVADADAGGAGGDGRWTPGDAVKTAVRVLEVAAGVAVVAAALALPLGLVAVALAWGARLAARRRRVRLPDAG